MICRPLAMLQEITCASPAYLARYGTPHTIEGLAGHVMIGFVSSRTHRTLPLTLPWMAARPRSVCPVGC
jgi:DNA-binding transcriptional LysR family regulator